MNYPLAVDIKNRIDSSSKILLNFHRNPDADSIGSCVALYLYLTSLGKEVAILSPSEVPAHLDFILDGIPVVITDPDKYDFSRHDLFISPDTSTLTRFFSSPHIQRPDTPLIVIDNHETNHGFGDINLLDYKTSSAAEMIYFLFEDWGVTINLQMANALLSGIIGDTGSFQFEVYEKTLSIAQKLIELGASLTEINLHLFNTVSLDLIKFWGVVIDNIKIDEGGVAWAAIPGQVFANYLHLKGSRETAVTMILRKIEKTKVCFVLTEDSENTHSVSFRARTNVDVAKIAEKLGGGGHPGAAGARLEGISFTDAVTKVVDLCKEAI